VRPAPAKCTSKATGCAAADRRLGRRDPLRRGPQWLLQRGNTLADLVVVEIPGFGARQGTVAAVSMPAVGAVAEENLFVGQDPDPA
jgi:hypothetical protein